jgi:hypothetical protein
LFEHVVFLERRQANHDRDAKAVKRHEAICPGMKSQRRRGDHVGALKAGRVDPVAKVQGAGGDAARALLGRKIRGRAGHRP